MPVGPYAYKNEFKNLTVEELEDKYNDLKNVIGFNSKDDYIRFEVQNSLSEYVVSNYYSEKVALEQLLKEKSGKDYYFKSEEYSDEIVIEDYIKYASRNDENKEKALSQFLNSLSDEEYTNISNELLLYENDKESLQYEFIIGLCTKNDSYESFFDELQNTNDAYNLFK